MKVIITGTTGMIGEGIMLECLRHPEISEVLSLSRRPVGHQHPRLKEYVVNDFLNIADGDPRLQGYDAVFFCAGVSAVGMSEEAYTKITYDTTLRVARAVLPGPRISFIYVSGGGTDSSEKGRMMWARVKGKTENDLFRLPFKQAFGFRIGFVKPARGQKYVLRYYKYLSWLLPVVKWCFANAYSTMQEVAHAMIFLSKNGYDRPVIRVKDIRQINHHISQA